MNRTEFGEKVKNSTTKTLVDNGIKACLNIQEFMRNAIQNTMFVSDDIFDSDLGWTGDIGDKLNADQACDEMTSTVGSSTSKISIDIESGDVGSYKLDIKDSTLENSEGGKTEKVCYGIEPKDFAGTVQIPDGVTIIWEKAFERSKAQRFILPESVKYIGRAAFARAQLKDIKLPSRVKVMQPYVFMGCKNLSRINLENVEAIAGDSFSYSGLVEVDIPNSVTSIGKGAFQCCKKLERVGHTISLTSVLDYAFMECDKLVEFDTSSLTRVGPKAFCSTGLSQINIHAEVGYIQSNTFTGRNIEAINIPNGSTKIADHAANNTDGKPIIWTISKDVINIGSRTIRECDTVRCWKQSTADAVARAKGAKIVYLDEDKTLCSTRTVKKAQLIGSDLNKLVSNVIKYAYDSQDTEYDFDLDETGLLKIKISPAHGKYLGIGFAGQDVPEGYEEKPKFKILLDHYRRASSLDISPLQSKYLMMSKTITVENREIYSDGVSRIIEFTFYDSKFFSLNSKLIIAFTGNIVRYSCLNNRLTDVWCRAPESKDIGKLIEAIQVGDIIGEKCILSGQKCDSIYGTTTRKVRKRGSDKDDPSAMKVEQIRVNLYQALFRSSIAVKMDKNKIALIMPVNKKVLLCNTIGDSVWNNENKESYKDRSCTVAEIVDLAESNKVFQYNPKEKVRDYQLFGELDAMSLEEVKDRIAEYSIMSPVTQNAYFLLAKYMMSNGMDSLNKLDINGVAIMMQLPIIESRTNEWFDRGRGKSIVDHSTSELEFAGGVRVRQYTTITRVALKNKLITGGDKQTYVFEVADFHNRRRGVYSAMKPLKEIFDDCSSVVNSLIDVWKGDKQPKEIYTNPEKFDVVDVSELTFIAEAFETKHRKNETEYLHADQLWLTVSNDDGKYYLVYVGPNYVGTTSEIKRNAVILLRIGDIDVIADLIYFEKSKMSPVYKILSTAGQMVITMLNRRNSTDMSRIFRPRDIGYYTSVLEARRLSIENKEDVESYTQAGVPARIAHMIGISTKEFTPLSDADYNEVFDDEYEVQVDDEDDYFSDELIEDED